MSHRLEGMLSMCVCVFLTVFLEAWLCTMSMSTTRPSLCASSMSAFSSSGEPNRLLAYRVEEGWGGVERGAGEVQGAADLWLGEGDAM